MVQVALADAEQTAGSDKTAEFEGGNQGWDSAPEDEIVGDCGSGGGEVFNAAVKGLFEVVSYEI